MPNIYDDRIYKDVLEAQLIRQATDKMSGLFFSELERLQVNQFLLKADEMGIAEAEDMFGITPNLVTEDLEFRRQRVINRNTTKPPYTFRYLRIKLDELFGAGNYTMRRDLAARTLYVESSVASSSWYHEVSLTVNKLKPANIVYINNPYIDTTITIAEVISAATKRWNYRLGTAWVLGALPFVSLTGGGIIKSENVKSLQPPYLQTLAVCGADTVTKVRINEVLEVTDFVLKEASGGEWTVEYDVASESVSQINKIELIDADGNVLTAATVYVPVIDQVRVKHKFAMREGA